LGDNVEADLSPRKQNLSQVLDKWCGYYMSIGVSYDEFWHSSTERLRYYYLAERQRIQRRNYELWLQGAYIYDAVGTVISNAFAKKGSTAKKYAQKPYDILEPTNEEKELKAKQERERLVRTLNQYMANFNARNKK